MNSASTHQANIRMKIDTDGIWLEFCWANGNVTVVRAEDLIIETQPAASTAIREWCADIRRRSAAR